MMKILQIVALLVTLTLLSALYVTREGRFSDIEARLVRLESIGDRHTTTSSSATVAPALPNIAPTVSATRPHAETRRHAALPPAIDDVLIQRQIDTLKNYTALTDEQELELSQFLEEEMNRPSLQLSEDELRARYIAREDRLKAILGDDVLKNIRSQQKENEELKRKDEREKDILLLSKELSLNSDQETKVRDILQRLDVDPVIQLQKGEASAVPTTDDPIKMMAESAAQRNLYLEEELRGTLSEDQFNKLLEYHALRENSTNILNPLIAGSSSTD